MPITVPPLSLESTREDGTNGYEEKTSVWQRGTVIMTPLLNGKYLDSGNILNFLSGVGSRSDHC